MAKISEEIKSSKKNTTKDKVSAKKTSKDTTEEKPIKKSSKDNTEEKPSKKSSKDIEEKPSKKESSKKSTKDDSGKKSSKKHNKKMTNDDSDEEEVNIKSKHDTDSKKDNKKDNRILEVKTTQTGALKQAIERISNVITDCCIVFIPPDDVENDNGDDDYYEEIEENSSKTKSKGKKSKLIDVNDKSTSKKSDTKNKKKGKQDEGDEEEGDEEKPSSKKSSVKPVKKNTGGIRILRLTEDKSILIKLNLDAVNFEYFRCDEPKITIGVDMHNLHALLKMVNDDDPIILYMNRDNRSALYIRSLNEDGESSEETDIEIYLMEIGNPEMPIPKTEFQNKITMASDKFHTICKHLNNNSTFVEITSISNEILFRGQNEGGKVTMSYKDVNYSEPIKKDKQEQLVQGVYELRNLLGFSKCNKLCNTIEIYLKNDFPLVLVISIATLGKMYVFLTPIENPNN